MNKKFNIIRINGFKGLLLALFCVGCLIAGFLIFPGWVCMHVWNYFAGFFAQAPFMNLVHGVLLWCIVALSLYALNNGDFAISLGSASSISPNEESIREVFSKINEKNARNIILAKKHLEEAAKSDNTESEHDDKLLK